jgi:(1->4)-alpha-D-glucan 1-alpha-D-glucosylmutase
MAQTVLAMTGEADLAERLGTHVEKALREAKRATFWSAPNAGVEDAARAYAARLSDLPHKVLAPLLDRAARLSLVQTALKLTLPGIPDIYQGCEIACFALTDPDNRRAVDFDTLMAAPGDPSVLTRDQDHDKLALTRRLLRLRRDLPDLFLKGAYDPERAPEGALGFTRRHGDRTLRVMARLDGGTAPEIAGVPVWPEAPDADSPVRITLD